MGLAGIRPTGRPLGRPRLPALELVAAAVTPRTSGRWHVCAHWLAGRRLKRTQQQQQAPLWCRPTGPRGVAAGLRACWRITASAQEPRRRAHAAAVVDGGPRRRTAAAAAVAAAAVVAAARQQPLGGGQQAPHRTLPAVAPTPALPTVGGVRVLCCGPAARPSACRLRWAHRNSTPRCGAGSRHAQLLWASCRRSAATGPAAGAASSAPTQRPAPTPGSPAPTHQRLALRRLARIHAPGACAHCGPLLPPPLRLAVTGTA